MSRRIALPGADELFRNTESPVFGDPADAGAIGPSRRPGEAPGEAADATSTPSATLSVVQGERTQAPSDVSTLTSGLSGGGVRSVRPARARRKSAERRPTGREAHDEKITVYVSAEELIDLEHAKIQLRSEQGLAVDRGRIVREAVAIVLADLEARGEDSIIVRRLRGI
jgi:hypothetical protein